MGNKKCGTAVFNMMQILFMLKTTKKIGTHDIKQNLSEMGIDYSLRTIQRCLIELQDAGFPIVGDGCSPQGWKLENPKNTKRIFDKIIVNDYASKLGISEESLKNRWRRRPVIDDSILLPPRITVAEKCRRLGLNYKRVTGTMIRRDCDFDDAAAFCQKLDREKLQ